MTGKTAAKKSRAKPVKAPPAVSDATAHLPFEVEELNRELIAFLATPFQVPGAKSPRGNRLGSLNWGVYTFSIMTASPSMLGEPKKKSAPEFAAV